MLSFRSSDQWEANTSLYIVKLPHFRPDRRLDRQDGGGVQSNFEGTRQFRASIAKPTFKPYDCDEMQALRMVSVGPSPQIFKFPSPQVMKMVARRFLTESNG